jgi:histidinol phosphatase-like PHP family hydrolase
MNPPKASTIAPKSRRGKSAGNSKPAQLLRMESVRTGRILNNSDIAELLAQESETARPPLQRAFRRAARRAFLWPEEASEIVAQNRSLAELSGIGPYLEKKIRAWMADPPAELPVPEIRTGFLSMPKAEAALTKKPQWLSLLKGDLQMHSNWSDGSGSIREMAEAGVERNYEYIAITDHSKGLKIAGGIDETQLLQQAEEIDEINQSLEEAGKKVRVLRSIELNLNLRGEGDMEEGALAKLDIVVGCFHSSLRKTEDQTERYLAALRNPAIQILGHPRGRIYNFRMGLKADWPRVFALAAELNKAVEIDSYPDRQDLSPDLVLLAKKAGCRISLSTDSHGPSQLSFIKLGLASAMLAGIKEERILNFMSPQNLLKWVQSARNRS